MYVSYLLDKGEQKSVIMAVKHVAATDAPSKIMLAEDKTQSTSLNTIRIMTIFKLETDVANSA